MTANDTNSEGGLAALAVEMRQYKGDYGTTIVVREFGSRLRLLLGLCPDRNQPTSILPYIGNPNSD